MPEETNREKAKRLLKRDPRLEKLRGEWKVIEDVLEGGAALLNKEYLPQHMNEHEQEYAKRLKLTPLLRETPEILQRRQGAMFKQAAKISVPEALNYIFSKASLSGSSIYDLNVKIGDHCQTQGFCGLLIDREPLPQDVVERANAARATAGLPGSGVSVAEATARALGRPMLALYAGGQILSIKKDWQGLRSVRLVESMEADGVCQHQVRIVTRETIQLIEISMPAQGEPLIMEHPPLLHGAVDANGKGIVPFFPFHPFPARDGLGRPVLKDAAESDAKALWVLSELCWSVYFTFPILTLTHNRGEDEADEVLDNLATSRLVKLRGGNTQVGAEAEKLAFVQRDVSTIEQLTKFHDKLTNKARDAGGRNAAAALPQPVEQSGVSKAWSFKTGEERVLFLITVEMKRVLQACLETMTRMLPGATAGLPGSAEISVEFPESFDLADATETFQANAEAADYFEAKGIGAAVAALLLKAAEQVLPDADETTWAEIETQIEALKTRELRSGAVLDAAGAAAADVLGKIPLGIQQLALARERANTAGDKKLSADLGKKIKELLGDI